MKLSIPDNCKLESIDSTTLMIWIQHWTNTDGEFNSEEILSAVEIPTSGFEFSDQTGSMIIDTSQLRKILLKKKGRRDDLPGNIGDLIMKINGIIDKGQNFSKGTVFGAEVCAEWTIRCDELPVGIINEGRVGPGQIETEFFRCQGCARSFGLFRASLDDFIGDDGDDEDEDN